MVCDAGPTIKQQRCFNIHMVSAGLPRELFSSYPPPGTWPARALLSPRPGSSLHGMSRRGELDEKQLNSALRSPECLNSLSPPPPHHHEQELRWGMGVLKSDVPCGRYLERSQQGFEAEAGLHRLLWHWDHNINRRDMLAVMFTDMS